MLQVPWSNIAIHVLPKEVILCLNDLCEYYSATTSCTCIYVSVFTGAPIPHLTSHRYHVVTCWYAMRGNYVALGRVDPSEVRIQIV